MLTFRRIFTVFIVLTSVWISHGAQDNIVDCVNGLLEWCDNIKVPDIAVGLSSSLTTSIGTSGGSIQSFHCTTGSDGTQCFKNMSPWFTCSRTKELTYKDNILQNDSENGADDETCKAVQMVGKAAESAVKMRNDFNQGMRNLDDAMSKLHQNIDNMNKNVFKRCFPFCGNNFSSRK